jgi:hypothetical protein
MGARYVLVLDPAERLYTGTTVTGLPADRGCATADLALDLLGLGAEFAALGSSVRTANRTLEIGDYYSYARQTASGLDRSKLPALASQFDNPLPSAVRPIPNTSLPARVTHELPPGQIRTPQETAQARNFFERNREAGIRWWSDRNAGAVWPEDATHVEHPRAIKNGGDPLFIEPGYGGPGASHMVPGADGLSDFQRWGRLGGRPRSK